MKHIVSISGGVGSYSTLKRILTRTRREDVVCVFMDTLNEDGDLYRFLNDIEQHLGIRITRLCTGKTPYQVSWENNFMFNSRVAKCSVELKSKPFMHWLKENYRPDECVLYLGIDWTESHRKDAIIRNYDPYTVKFPMCEKPYINKPEMIEELSADGIEVPRLYRLGFAHNNCRGCCFKAGIGQYKLLWEKDRPTFYDIENKEEEMRIKTGKDVSILKRNGKPFTLRQLRTLLENRPDQISLFESEDFGGCGCFVGDDTSIKGE